MLMEQTRRFATDVGTRARASGPTRTDRRSLAGFCAAAQNVGTFQQKWAHEESNPESSARQADVLPLSTLLPEGNRAFDYRPSGGFLRIKVYMGSSRTCFMASTAFCPAYATGIFTIGDDGAAGAGFTLSKGLCTSVSAAKGGKGKITIGGKESPAPVSKAVLARFAKQGCGVEGLEIVHSPEVPVGFGLGMSAAGALSLALALNEFLGAGFSRQECVRIAHDAEVECGTGLSGADAASFGGFLFQEKIGEPPSTLEIGKRTLHFAFFSPMKTSDVIFSPEWKGKVNAAGSKALAALAKSNDYGGFVLSCRQFSAESGLSEWGKGIMEKNPRACMAMLGHTLFSDEKLVGVEAASAVIEAEAPAGRAEIV